MNILKNSPVYLLSLVYLVFGSNFFLHFIPNQPMPGTGGEFAGILFATNFLLLVKLLELSLALLLLVPKTRALALLLIAPISLNILLFHLLIAQAGAPMGILLVLLNGIAIFQSKSKYMGIIA